MIMTSHPERAHSPSYVDEHRGVCLQCPRCNGWLGYLSDKNTTEIYFFCSDCSFKLENEQGVWKSLFPERTEHFTRFIQDYQTIRSAEGRGSVDASYYLALPYRDLSGNNNRQWQIRTQTFRYIERYILPSLYSKDKKQLRILDLGAGNGWMSYRLALAGHAPIAVDLLTNDRDGLGAAIHYRKNLVSLFPRFQAELDKLPFANNEFDVAIYNASFHYSEHYEKTLAEALRCVRVGGTVLIADTPWYSREASGEEMIVERRKAFTQRYGFPSDGLDSLEYLTDQRLERLEACFGIRWQKHTPNYGARWLMRPLLAKIHGKREPSQFRIYTAKARK
jgi:SAM-dependent methyltransferase